MSGRSKKSGADRRGFLKLAGLGALTGTAMLGGGKNVAEAREDQTDDRMYRESEHVKTYYKLARF